MRKYFFAILIPVLLLGAGCASSTAPNVGSEPANTSANDASNTSSSVQIAPVTTGVTITE